MNYSAHYERLIACARGRHLIVYRERHHVIPRCIGGDDTTENVVELTGEEHYVAHQLLVKIHPEVSGLAYAAIRMAKQCTGNKAYGWLRRRYATGLRGRKRPPRSPEWSAKLGHRRGTRQTPETRKKIAASLLGKKMAPRSPDHSLKISLANTGRKPSLEARLKMSASRTGKKRSPEAIAKAAAAMCGRKWSPEHRAKISASLRGKHPSAESRAKMSAAQTGKKMAPEAIAKTAAANRGRVCLPETRELLRAANRAYWKRVHEAAR